MMVKNEQHVDYSMNNTSTNQLSTIKSNPKEIYPWMNEKKQHGNDNNSKKNTLLGMINEHIIIHSMRCCFCFR